MPPRAFQRVTPDRSRPVFAIEKSAVRTEDELVALRELLRRRVPARE
jgi:hypothetical protein